MHHALTFLVLLSLLCAACGEDAAPPGPVEVEGPGYRGVILPASAWADYAYEVEGFWDVSAEDVRRAEAALPVAAKQRAPDLEVPLERYTRQYVGVVMEGRRLLYLNLLHEDSLRSTPDDTEEERGAWRRELVVVDDGGDWYVEAFFDSETGEFTELWVHGEA